MRITASSEDVLTFLSARAYPHEYTLAQLDACLRLRLETRDGAVVGYVWGHWTNPSVDVLDMHVCIDPAWHGRWVSRRVIAIIANVAHAIGARLLMARPQSEEHAALLRRAGFIEVDENYVMPLE